MKIKNICLLIAALFQIGCSSSDSVEEEVQISAPEFVSSIPENNAVNVRISTNIEVVFNEDISLAEDHGITINDESVNVEASSTKLIFTVDLENDLTYTINIPQEAVLNTLGNPLASEIQISFTTVDASIVSEGAMQFVANMGVGWNLGNTLDTRDADETTWGNPLTTKSLIDVVRNKGFKTLRVPVTWQYHMGAAPDYTIEKDWLDRVEEVVNYGLDNDMYVIINIHHDDEWVIPTYAELDRTKDQLGKVWTQIASRFKSYSNYLIFETLNEPRLAGSDEQWKGGTAEGRDCLNQLQQIAVDAIRNTGGENTDRYIMVSTYGASRSSVALDGFVLPSGNNLIVSVHGYSPYKFCMAQSNYNTTWGTDAEKEALDAEFDKVKAKFIDNGIAVVMAEWGTIDHDNLEYRIEYAEYYAKGCIQRGICPVLWDDGGWYIVLNRDSYQWKFPGIADAIVSATEE